MLEPLIRFITRLEAYSEPVTSGNAPVASVWVAHLPGARLSIGLSPEKSRGFSGEGSVLQALSDPSVAENADMLSVLLSFEPRIEVPVMSARSGLKEMQVRDALALLASSGQVGFDVQAGGVLPPAAARAGGCSAGYASAAGGRAETGGLQRGAG